jgi:hypothetical protein
MIAKTYYYRDKDQAFLVDDDQVKRINKAVMHNLPVNFERTLYPIFENPTEKEIRAGKTRRSAWQIRPHSCPTVRWYWQIQEHKKGHTGCKPLGDGLCGFKMVRFYEWNESASKWELSPMVNHADLQQEQVLDNNR